MAQPDLQRGSRRVVVLEQVDALADLAASPSGPA
jgi:hypothetical protein